MYLMSPLFCEKGVILFKDCYCSCPCTIQGRTLYKGGHYLRKYGSQSWTWYDDFLKHPSLQTSSSSCPSISLLNGFYCTVVWYTASTWVLGMCHIICGLGETRVNMLVIQPTNCYYFSHYSYHIQQYNIYMYGPSFFPVASCIIIPI